VGSETSAVWPGSQTTESESHFASCVTVSSVNLLDSREVVATPPRPSPRSPHLKLPPTSSASLHPWADATKARPLDTGRPVLCALSSTYYPLVLNRIRICLISVLFAHFSYVYLFILDSLFVSLAFCSTPLPSDTKLCRSFSTLRPLSRIDYHSFSLSLCSPDTPFRIRCRVVCRRVVVDAMQGGCLDGLCHASCPSFGLGPG